MFTGKVVKHGVAQGDVRALEFKALLSVRNATIVDGKALLFLEKEAPLIVGRPFKFPRHGQRADRTGLHAMPQNTPLLTSARSSRGINQTFPRGIMPRRIARTAACVRS